MDLARTLNMLGRTEQAGKKFEEALRLAPGNIEAVRSAFVHYIEIKDLDQAVRVIEDFRGSTDFLGWARAVIALEQGDPGGMKILVEEWVHHRDSRYVRASAIAGEYYRLGDYEQYMNWFAVQEEELDALSILPLTLRQAPNYWDKLREWALTDHRRTRERWEMIDGHRRRIDRVTERMVL